MCILKLGLCCLFFALICSVFFHEYKLSLSVLIIITNYYYFKFPLSIIIINYPYQLSLSIILINYHYQLSLSFSIILFNYPFQLSLSFPIIIILPNYHYHDHLSLLLLLLLLLLPRSIASSEKIRGGLSCKSRLVVVCGGNRWLRLTPLHRYTAGITTSVVDRCIVVSSIDIRPQQTALFIL